MEDAGSNKSECVKVVIRCRPMSGQEEMDGRERVVDVDTKNSLITVRKPNEKGAGMSKPFTFDAVYDWTSNQVGIYEDTASIIVDSVLDGYNGTVFAYGQTGTGKTFTMVGALDNQELQGMIPRAFEHIFSHIATTGDTTQQFLVRASYLEIYNEEIRDLLSKNPKSKLDLKDNPDSGVYVKDLSAFVVKSVAEMHQVMAAGTRNRSVGQTLMNETSSRSHSIFTITIETSAMGIDGQPHIRVGKLNMVDLAGSERQSKTGATGDTLKEATKINLSLSALGNVISALTDGKHTFIPYRDSKLTRLLQDSLGGNTKTAMVANVGPADYNYDETISTLRYAHRAKSIQNKPKINEDPKDTMIREFQEEIMRLKKQVEMQRGGQGKVVIVGEDGEERVVEERIVEKVIEIEKDMGMGTAQDAAALEHQMAQEKAELEAALMAEKQRIDAEKNMAEDDKQRLIQELMEKEAQAEAERKVQADLINKVKAMEEKLLAGSHVMEQAKLQESELKKAQRNVADAKRNEKKLAKLAEKNLDEKFLLQEKFNSVEEQVQKLTTKLEKLWERYKAVQTEINDLQQEFQAEREDLLETIRSAAKEVKLKTLLMDEFVPSSMRLKIEQHSRWDEQEGTWIIEKLHLAGNNIVKEQEQTKARDPHAWNPTPTPNVYFVYDAQQGMVSAESRVKNKKDDRKNQTRSAKQRPNTASKKGRSNTRQGSTSHASAGVFDDPLLSGGYGGYQDYGGGGAYGTRQSSSQAFPKARGLVKQ